MNAQAHLNLTNGCNRAPRCPASTEHEARRGRLEQAIRRAAHLLPAQGPISVFIHHNTLHAFEDLPFTVAVEKAAEIFGSQPYLTEKRYREELARGRIRFEDLEAVLREDMGYSGEEGIVRDCTRSNLRLAMLEYPLRHGPAEELCWYIAETDALRRVRSDVSAAMRGRLIAETRHWVMRDLRAGQETGASDAGKFKRAEAVFHPLFVRFGVDGMERWTKEEWEALTLEMLWHVCVYRSEQFKDAMTGDALQSRHRDLVLQALGIDIDVLVNDVLIRFCSAFLDQGLAHHPLPRREHGFFRSFIALYRQYWGPPARWLSGLVGELTRLESENRGPLDSILESLDLLGVSEVEWEVYTARTMTALRGWAGMLHFLEERPDRATRPIPAGSLVEYLAIRLVLERQALIHVMESKMPRCGGLSELRLELHHGKGLRQGPGVEQRAFAVFQLAQVLGWTPEELYRLRDEDWIKLVREMESFGDVERRRYFHLAYERRFYDRSLDALACHDRTMQRHPACPGFQALFCIDEREESLRRHLEELAPDATTFGIAGFFFLDMYYRGIADAYFVPLCPAILRPRYWVEERVAGLRDDTHHRRANRRRVMGMAARGLHQGSRAFAYGALLSASVGVLASIPLVARTLFPSLTARLRRSLGRIVYQPPPTRLHMERAEPRPGPENGCIGLTVAEMVETAERVLRDSGLTQGFARLVLLIGHGSTSMNNPHESAYDCGACGGSSGGPNARAAAWILNDARVRLGLSLRGLSVPDETVFVGALHNTCNDSVTFHDLDCLPESHRDEFEHVRRVVDQACARNAHERCRRFESAPLDMSFSAARQHVENRAEDLAQARPECGHATNALCVVGRRQCTRGLFLDRRAFLVSYDPTQDDGKGTILQRILQAVVPVCGGISLEYFFSYVDNAGYGCGTKLPHNVAALLGVMDGALSDLRTGLPWQMVEIHEPMRLLLVVEAVPETMLEVLERDRAIGGLIRNGWVRLALLNPHSSAIKIYRDGIFEDYNPQSRELPRVAASVDWYRGWRDHLDFADIGPCVGAIGED